VQYTRNMVTGASNADLAIVLVDARQGVIEQTRRHSIIAALLGIKHFVLAVNKMDLVNYDEQVFRNIVADYQDITKLLKLTDVTAIPMSALQGDNIVRRSDHLGWYTGPSLLEHLETVPGAQETKGEPRFQVQYVVRPQTAELPDYRGYAGQIQSGSYRRGDKVQILPSGLESTIEAIEINQQAVEEAVAPQGVILRLADDVDISRGDTIVPIAHAPHLTRELEATLCWMAEAPLRAGRRFLLQHHAALVKASLPTILYRLDVQSLTHLGADEARLNDIVRVRLKTAVPLAADTYRNNRRSGSFILVDEQTGNTVAAGLIEATDPDYFTVAEPGAVAFSI